MTARPARDGKLILPGGRRARDSAGKVAPLLGVPVVLPIVTSSTFAFGSVGEMFDVFLGRRPGFRYAREGNPTVEAVERELAQLVRAPEAMLFGSGMAAISTTLLAHCRPGDVLVAGKALYGGTHEFLESVAGVFGIQVDRVDTEDSRCLLHALARRPRLLYVELPTNPLLRLADVQSVFAEARKHDVLTVVDSTFGPPGVQRPSEWGADVVLHSGTKYLGGHGDLLCGVAAGSSRRMAPVRKLQRVLGGVCDPFSAYLLHRGLKTLEVRVARQSETALLLARKLRAHPSVARVHYPGFASREQARLRKTLLDQHAGGVLSFELKGGLRAARRCMNSVRQVRLATSLGGPETLLSHPATSSHLSLPSADRKAIGIGPGLLRLAVGLEDPGLLWSDLRASLRADG